MLCRVLRCLWPLGKWKMEEEGGQQHDCGVYGCCALNTCENSGMRRWGIFLFRDWVSLFLKNKSHYMFFLTELPSIGWTRNVFSLSPYFCPQMLLILHSSADLFSLAWCISEDSLLCAGDKTYIIHGAQMPTNVKSWKETVQHVNNEHDCPADLRQATRKGNICKDSLYVTFAGEKRASIKVTQVSLLVCTFADNSYLRTKSTSPLNTKSCCSWVPLIYSELWTYLAFIFRSRSASKSSISGGNRADWAV